MTYTEEKIALLERKLSLLPAVRLSVDLKPGDVIKCDSIDTGEIHRTALRLASVGVFRGTHYEMVKPPGFWVAFCGFFGSNKDRPMIVINGVGDGTTYSTRDVYVRTDQAGVVNVGDVLRAKREIEKELADLKRWQWLTDMERGA